MKTLTLLIALLLSLSSIAQYKCIAPTYKVRQYNQYAYVYFDSTMKVIKGLKGIPEAVKYEPEANCLVLKSTSCADIAFILFRLHLIPEYTWYDDNGRPHRVGRL